MVSERDEKAGKAANKAFELYTTEVNRAMDEAEVANKDVQAAAKKAGSKLGRSDGAQQQNLFGRRSGRGGSGRG
ncbi:hypothetical protein [Kribbella solani]|uniref:Uncharacterized protein n=1 Tax=Kribbella solani TaxID=236067 RepID=A0A841DQX1_9ACTN|nr:hypothetical protein [Kribbella solani]MBB5980279.1 hypothetical protein [Kribbella solani]